MRHSRSLWGLQLMHFQVQSNLRLWMIAERNWTRSQRQMTQNTTCLDDHVVRNLRSKDHLQRTVDEKKAFANCSNQPMFYAISVSKKQERQALRSLGREAFRLEKHYPQSIVYKRWGKSKNEEDGIV